MFRPCIDLHEGRVKQIVGGSLRDDSAAVRTNYVAPHPASWYASLYQRDNLKGGHVILLGPPAFAAENRQAALEALAAYPGGLQVGGGVTVENAREWLVAGASHVIVTSWVFREGRVDWDRLQALARSIGREHLVLDLSCRKREGQYYVVTDRWQKFTQVTLEAENMASLADFCDEFLIHAADVEGLCLGIDLELVELLGRLAPLPTTYAGGARSLEDLRTVTTVGQGRIHLTIGSALDIFGGTGVRYADAVAFNRQSTAP